MTFFEVTDYLKLYQYVVGLR